MYRLTLIELEQPSPRLGKTDMGPLLQATEGYKALYANMNLGVYKYAESFDAKPLFHEAEAFLLGPSCKETSNPYEVYLWAF